MADRQQNINIKYNINTADVEKAAAASVRAQVATDKLTDSAKKFSDQSVSGNRQAVSSIEAMTLKIAQLKGQIENTSTADKKRLTELSNQYKALNKQLDEQKKKYLELNQAQKSLADSTKSFASGMGQLVSAVKLFVTAGIVKETVDLALNMARLSGNVEGVERAFNRINGSVLVLEDLRRATHGTVTDFELMQRALKAQNFGISLDALGSLLEFASIRAQQTGQNVDYFVNSIVDGIGRKSLRVLDNLQISQSRIKEQLGGISMEAASVAQVSEAMGRIASEEIKKMGGFAETSATAVGQLEVAMEELRIEVSKFGTDDDNGFIGFLTRGVKGIKELIRARLNLSQVAANATKDAIKEQATQTALEIKGRALAMSGEQEKIDFIQQEINSRVQLVGQYNDEIAKLKERTKLIRGFGFPGFNEENPEGAKRMAELQEQFGTRAREIFEQENEAANKELKARLLNKAVIQETMALLGDYLKSLTVTNATTEEQLGIIESLEARIKSLGEALKEATTFGEAKSIQSQIEVTQEVLKRFVGAISDTPPTVDTANKRTAKSFDQLATDVEGATERMMNGVRELKFVIGSGLAPDTVPRDFIDKLEDAAKAAKDTIANSGIDILQNQIVATSQIQLQELENQLISLREFYDQEQLLAGDNEKAKKAIRLREEQETNALRRQIAQKDKETRLFSIAIDTAAGIIRAFATLPTPAAVVQSGIIAALGISQAAIVKRTPIPKFAQGVIDLKGPGTSTSDSIPSMLSRGESVMTGAETQRAKGIFQAVRAKKLDDRVLKDLKLSQAGVKYVGMTDDRIVKELQELRESQPDFVQQASILYEVKTKGKNYRQIVRSKSMGI